jgi:hypothetical protein
MEGSCDAEAFIAGVLRRAEAAALGDAPLNHQKIATAMAIAPVAAPINWMNRCRSAKDGFARDCERASATPGICGMSGRNRSNVFSAGFSVTLSEIVIGISWGWPSEFAHLDFAAIALVFHFVHKLID